MGDLYLGKTVGVLRVVEDDKGVQHLEATYSPSACGCLIEGGGTIAQPLKIKLCKKHKNGAPMKDERKGVMEAYAKKPASGRKPRS